MRVRLFLGALAAGAVSLVLVGAGPAGAASVAKTSVTKTLTLHLVEKDHGFNFIDNPPRQGVEAPPLIGDELAFNSELVTTSGAHAGWVEATCMVAMGGTRASGPCYGVFRLKGGTLMAMALTKFYGNAPNEIVIVGGTGAYAGATGTIHSVTKTESTNDDTVQLTWS